MSTTTQKDILESRAIKIEYTNGQETALKKIQKFIATPGEYFFLLAGYSGCGKTTIAENIVNFAKADVLAPTNSAVNRLREKILGSSASFATIHACLFAPKDDNGSFRKEKSFSQKKTYVIDECSMIDKWILDIIIKEAIDKECKIIFIGDSFQLEPIGTDPKLFSWEKTDPINFLPHNRFELTEVRRYDGTLLKIATELRITKSTQITMPEESDLQIVNCFTKRLGNDILKNKSYVVLTATNQKRVEYNAMIRRFRYKDILPGIIEEERDRILPDEKLISISNSTHYSNGELFVAKNLKFISEVYLDIWVEGTKAPKRKNPNQRQLVFEDNGPAPKVERSIKFYLYREVFETKEEDSMDDDMMSIFGRNWDTQDHSKYILFSPRMKEPSFHGPTLVKAYMENRLRMPKSIGDIMFVKARSQDTYYFKKNVTIATFGYAISCHKAQGNEWDNIYIDAPFLSESWNHARWFYTAISRAKSNVELLPTKYLTIKT